MMQVMKDIGGVEMPEYLARLTPEQEMPNGAATPEAKVATGRSDSSAARPPKG